MLPKFYHPIPPLFFSVKHIRLHLQCRTLKESESCLHAVREGKTGSVSGGTVAATDDSLEQRGGEEGKID